MRKLICLSMLASTLAWTSATSAATPTKESIDALLAMKGVEKTLDGMLANLDGAMKRHFAAASDGQSSNPEQQQRIEVISDRLRDIFREEMTWSRLQPIYEQIYAETFTPEEIDGLIAFYRTPTGMAYVDKLPIALQKSITAMQPLMASMMQKIQVAAKRINDEEKAKR